MSRGWYVAYVYDPARNSSDLVIIDAADFSGDPVARIRLPRRVPYGFHIGAGSRTPDLCAHAYQTPTELISKSRTQPQRVVVL